MVAWREDFVARIDGPARVHVKLDTGMGRLGTRDADEATRVAEAVAARPRLTLAGAMTHFATADEPGDAFFGEQLERFAAWALPLRERHPGIVVHAANSAGALRDPAARFDLVRTGIAVYGMDPFHRDPADHGLEPALELRSYVAEVKPCAAGESAGYGRRFVAERATTLATVPIGYGDGVRRALTNDADVLVRGARMPLRGTVSMDNVTLDLGPDGGGVRRGDDAVLIGAQGPRARARRGVGAAAGHDQLRGDVRHLPRVPRAYHRDGVPDAVIEALRDALGGERAWLVGGAVRDRLLERAAAGDDLDVAVGRRRARPGAAPGAGHAAARRSSSPTSSAAGAWSARDRPGRSTSRRSSAARSRATWPPAT